MGVRDQQVLLGGVQGRHGAARRGIHGQGSVEGGPIGEIPSGRGLKDHAPLQTAVAIFGRGARRPAVDDHPLTGGILIGPLDGACAGSDSRRDEALELGAHGEC